MINIDLPTVYFSYILVNIINLLLSSFLYFQIKKRFPGTLLIVLSMFMNTTGNILVFLRDHIPDWLSIPVANVFIVSSLISMFVGLEQFVKKKSSTVPHFIFIFIFFIIHSYFTFIDPNLKARHYNITIGFLFYSIFIVHLMFIRTPKALRSTTRPIGYVFVLVFIIQLFRVYFLVQNTESTKNYFSSSSGESIFIMLWELIVILLAYSLSLMYNKRLIIDVNNQEEKFSKAFHSAPFIIVLSKHSDGEIFEVNKKIVTISGYLPNELIGSKTIDLKLWGDDEERLKFMSDLNSKGSVIEHEYLFRKKSGELFPGLISAEIVNINNEPCIISVINDITNRKKSELKLQKSEASLRK
ncbi:PAS domain S-box protein [Christiangramia sp. SM2212]|uniref:PAS domain S-box protein n=1 Tax=Christiangramia sediminicola TaxID=3073267 RepID=A0ABU1EUJ1_9FLAO|nr:PAS domain S-box protein [Christiangramia sp. SM2212]MDR5592057.1 PAS domain S-box protein [Christiangramia sp. SM2212]